MKTGEKAFVVFFGIFSLAALVSLFLPAMWETTATKGLSGLFGVPMWVLALATFIICGANVVFAFLNVKRRRNGRPPL